MLKVFAFVFVYSVLCASIIYALECSFECVETTYFENKAANQSGGVTLGEKCLQFVQSLCFMKHMNVVGLLSTVTIFYL